MKRPGLRSVCLLILLLATLYKVAPNANTWRRGLPGALLAAAVFLIASFGLRLYLSYVYTRGLVIR